MKTFLIGFLMAIVIPPVLVFLFFRLGFADVQANVRPPTWESRVLFAAVHHSVARQAAGIVMPGATTEERLVRGGKLFMNGCAGCHGELGKPFGEDHTNYPRVPQLPHIGTRYTGPQIYWVVKHGVRMTAMSAYGRFYSEEELWSIAVFVRQIRNLPVGVQERILAKP